MTRELRSVISSGVELPDELELIEWCAKEGFLRLPSGNRVLVCEGDELLIEQYGAGVRVLAHYPRLRH